MTFWPHRGTEEWVEFELPVAESVSGVEVFWFDDTGVGQCRVPASWKVQVRADANGPWQDVTAARPGVADRFDGVAFTAVSAKFVRVVAKLQKDFSAGVLEMKLK